MNHISLHRIASALLASTLALTAAQTAQAATSTNVFRFSVDDQSIFGPGQGAGIELGGPINLPGATANIGGSANSGTVDANVRQTVTTTFSDTVALSASGTVRVNLDADRNPINSASFSTRIGADAQANIDPNAFLGFNIGPIGLNENYTIQTSDRTSLTSDNDVLNASLSDSGAVALGGPSLPSIPVGITVEAGIDLEARQSARLELDDLSGVVRARHSSGITRTQSFSLTTRDRVDLDLGLVGTWALDLLGVTLNNTFTTTFGLGGTAFLGLGVGVFCGDTSDPDDNVFCAGEFFNDVSTPSLNFINFDNPLDFQTRTASLGNITVFDDTPPTSPVPLPAGLPMLLAGLGGLVLLRRRKG